MESNTGKFVEKVKSFNQMLLDLEEILKSLFADDWIPYVSECNLAQDLLLLKSGIEQLKNVKDHMLDEVDSKYKLEQQIDDDEKEGICTIDNSRTCGDDSFHTKDEKLSDFRQTGNLNVKRRKSKRVVSRSKRLKNHEPLEFLSVQFNTDDEAQNSSDQELFKQGSNYYGFKQNSKKTPASVSSQPLESDSDDEFAARKSDPDWVKEEISSEDEFADHNSDCDTDWMKEESSFNEEENLDLINLNEPTTEADQSTIPFQKKVLKIQLERLNLSDSDSDTARLKIPVKLKRPKINKRRVPGSQLIKSNKIQKPFKKSDEHRSGQGQFSIKCPICDPTTKEFSAEPFLEHIKDFHGYSNIFVFKSKFPNCSVPIQCTKCQNWLENGQRLAWHERTKCGTIKCFREIVEEVLVKRRSGYYKKNQDYPIECGICFQKFLPINVRQHYLTHGKKFWSSGKLRECSKCGKKMTFQQLPWHISRGCTTDPSSEDNDNSKKNSQRVECSLCPRKIRSRNLQKHIETCHGKGEHPFQCSYSSCLKTFPDKHQLKRHSEIHAETKPFSCTVCGVSFHQNSNLTQHMRKHSEERPFKCEKCPDTFRFSQSLKKHIEGRHSENGVQCSQCGLLFTTKAKMKQHIQCVHECLRPFICELCGKAYKRGEHLKRHIPTHNNPKTKNRGLNKQNSFMNGGLLCASGKPRVIRNKWHQQNNNEDKMTDVNENVIHNNNEPQL